MRDKTKVLPHNKDAEQSILGGILIDKEAIHKVADILKIEDFYFEQHRLIYQAIIEMTDRNEPVDLISLTDFFLKKGILDKVGGAGYLSSILDNIASSANISHYAKIVKEKAILRKLINVSGDIYNSCFEPVDDVEGFLDKTEEKIFSITQKERTISSVSPIKEVLTSSYLTIERLWRKKETITGIPTGFSKLDKLTAGLQPTDLIIIAGRPGMGKTSFALSILKNAAILGNEPCAFFSLEMSREQIGLRLICAEAKIELHKLRTGFLDKKDMSQITHAISKLSNANIYIDDTPAISVLELRSKARRLKTEKNIGLIIIDYLQLMRGSDRRENREQEISEISRSLKALAKELNIPVIALSQLNRAVETGKGMEKRPQLAHLRESGAIEQDSDVIMFIYREEYYLKLSHKEVPEDKRNIAEIIIAKQRNGPTDTVEVFFNDKLTLFSDIAPNYTSNID
ncbi:MAG: replicative DNA helicase [Proteobacteria bacterium]|nr:replicative DNA helicase [Pseudomonadota bacterium]